MAGRHYTPLGYCDKTDVENFLLLDIDQTFDEQIDDWIATAEKQANQYMGYTTASGVLMEAITDEKAYGYVDSDMNLMVFPRKTPIDSVTGLDLVKGSDSLSIDLTTGDGSARYDIPTSGDYILYPDYELSITGESIIHSFSNIARTKFFYKLDYRAGYTTVPEEIRQATINLVADIVMRHSNKEGLEGITQGRVTKRYWSRTDGHSDFWLDAMSLLRPYRIASRWL